MNFRRIPIISLAAALTLAGCSESTDTPDGAVADSTAPEAMQVAPPPANQTLAAALEASPQHRLLHGALDAADLLETLDATGPVTVFAPTDAGFVQVPPITREGWMRPAQKPVLQSVLNHHIMAGKIDTADLATQIEVGGGRATLETLGGQQLIVSKAGDNFILTSASGNKAAVIGADRVQSNGLIHDIDAVLLPPM